MPERARKWIIGAAVAGLLFVALLAVAFGTSVAGVSPCERCHSRATFASETAKGPHSDVPCSSCHGGTGFDARLSFASQQVLGMYLRVRRVDPSVANVESRRCLACHRKSLAGTSEANGLRIVHSKCAVRRQCTDCHSSTTHLQATSWPRTATMELCFDCHGANATKQCDACHSARLPADRIKTGAFAVTHGPNWERTHGAGNMKTCSACHTQAKCTRCHGAGLPHDADFFRRHNEVAVSPKANCTMCHTKTFCTNCHGLQMPHPRKFISTHPQTVKARGEKRCLLCHQKSDCNDCHLAHVHPTTLEELKSLGVDLKGDRR